MTVISTVDEPEELVLEMEDLDRSDLEFDVFVFVVQNEVAICGCNPTSWCFTQGGRGSDKG